MPVSSFYGFVANLRKSASDSRLRRAFAHGFALKNSSWRMTFLRETRPLNPPALGRGLFEIFVWYVFVSAWCWRCRSNPRRTSCQKEGLFFPLLLLFFRYRLRLDWSSHETWSFLSLSFALGYNDKNLPKTEEKPIEKSRQNSLEKRQTRHTFNRDKTQRRKEETDFLIRLYCYEYYYYYYYYYY